VTRTDADQHASPSPDGDRPPTPGSGPVTARTRLASLLEREVLRFGLVGMVNTALDLGIFLALQLGGVPVIIANLISTSAGLAFSFGANRVFTFSGRTIGRTGAGRQLLLFVLCTGIGLWAVQPLVILAVDHLLAPYAAMGAWRILIAKCVAIGFGLVWNWTLYNRVVFRARRP
jgi:putative flippase GtrA